MVRRSTLRYRLVQPESMALFGQGRGYMECCRVQVLDTEFDRNVVARDLHRYRQRGPAKTTRFLLAALDAEGVAGRTLLDIGGGVGAISHAMLRSGAIRAYAVDASQAYVEAARAEAERQGHADRLTLRHGDFVALAETVPPVDIVTLDRVVCCYPDMPELIGASVDHARRVYGLVYPRDTWWIKVGVGLANCVFRLRRRRFRAYVHASADVDGLVRAQGFALRFRRTTAIWQVVVYARA
jgi:hypothetical protein